MSRPELTADLCARAIVAAARAVDMDPVRAMTSPMGSERFPLRPAAEAVRLTCDLRQRRVAALFGLSSPQAPQTRARHPDRFDLALTQALLAIGGVKAALAADPDAPLSAHIDAQPAIVVDCRPVAVSRPVKSIAPPRVHHNQLATDLAPKPPLSPLIKPAREFHLSPAPSTGDCKWIGEDGAGCGEATGGPRAPYCAAHAAVVYQPGAKRPIRAPRGGDRTRPSRPSREHVAALDGRP